MSVNLKTRATRAAERRQKVAHGVSRGTSYGVDIGSPGGATETVREDLSPLRG
jgi:hypothetical protein